MIILTSLEARYLSEQGVLEIFRRWGIHLNSPHLATEELVGDYVQLSVNAIPAALSARLGRKEGKELGRLVELYLELLKDGLGEVQAMCR